MAGSKRQRLSLQSNFSPLPSNRLSGKMDPVTQSQTPPTLPSPTDTTATSMDVVGDQPIPALSAVSGLEDNNDLPQSPTPGPQSLSQYKVPQGFFLLFGKLHPLTPPTDTTATSDQPIPAASEVNGPQDTDNLPQPPAPGPNAPVLPRRNGTILDPKGVGFSRIKRLKLWESYLWIPGVQIPRRSKKGIQIFLGYYLTKQEAQDVHDRAALKLSETEGVVPVLNFHESRHAEFMEEYKDWNFRDFLWQFRRSSVRFTTGKSCMKGVVVKGNLFEAKTAHTYSQGVGKVLYYLGKFESEEEAGRAYDRALLFLHYEETEAQKWRVITNFRPSTYSESEVLRAGNAQKIRKPILPEMLE